MPDGIDVKINASAEFVVNALNNAGIGVNKVSAREKHCLLTVKSRDYDNMKKIMEGHGKTVTVLSNRSFRHFFYKNAVRFGLYAGLLIAVIAVIFYSVNVTRVVIGGNKLVDDEAIYRAVLEVTDLPADKKSIDRQKLERAVIALEGISSASVQLKGNTLLVNVYEELGKVDVIDKTDYKDVVSNYDGIVTRVIVYSGSAAVKSGDTVKSGQVLISSDIILDEALTAKERALGEVYGRVWVSKSLVYPPTVMVRKRTGRTETVVKAFVPQTKYKGDFALYETETVSYYSESVIPVKYYVTTYYEVVETEREFDFDANYEGIIKEATETLESELPAESEKCRTWYTIKRLDKTVYLEIYYEIEIKIND